MRIHIENCRLLFEASPNSSVRRSHILKGVVASIETSAEFIIIDQTQAESEYRWIFKYNVFGDQALKMMLDIKGYRNASVHVADDNTSYSIDDVPRYCITPIFLVFGMNNGEVVVLDPRQAPDPTRNVYRYNADGSLRWQIGSRDFRPSDEYWGVESLKNGNVLARASLNGWSAEVDDATGTVLRIASTDER